MKILNKAWFDPWGTPAAASYVLQLWKQSKVSSTRLSREVQIAKVIGDLSVWNILTASKVLLVRHWIAVMQSNGTQLSQVFEYCATHPTWNRNRLFGTQGHKEPSGCFYHCRPSPALGFPTSSYHPHKDAVSASQNSLQSTDPLDSTINSFPILKSLIYFN